MLWHPHGEFCCINAVHQVKGKVEPGEHKPYVDHSGPGFRGMCECGWHTEWFNLRGEAELACESHERKTQPRTEPSIWDRT